MGAQLMEAGNSFLKLQHALPFPKKVQCSSKDEGAPCRPAPEGGHGVFINTPLTFSSAGRPLCSKLVKQNNPNPAVVRVEGGGHMDSSPGRG